MSKTKRAAQVLQHRDGMEKQFSGQAVNSSDFNSSTAGRGFQGRIASLLPAGEENAMRSAEIRAALGIKTTRHLQAEIEYERLHGALILSTCRNHGGYYLPGEGETGQREIADFVRTVSARAHSSLRILRAFRKAMKIPGGQIKLEEMC